MWAYACGMCSEQTLMFDHEDLSLEAIAVEAVRDADLSYCKFLSANDTGATGGHQSGILINRTAWPLLFNESDRNEHIAKRNVTVLWQDDWETISTFTYYQSKGELRLTKFGRDFPYLDPSMTGALFVLARKASDYYVAFILDGDELVDGFLASFGMGPQDTGRLIDARGVKRNNQSAQEDCEIESYVWSLGLTPDVPFPKSNDVSAIARQIQRDVYNHEEMLVENPDFKLVSHCRHRHKHGYSVICSAYAAAVGGC